MLLSTWSGLAKILSREAFQNRISKKRYMLVELLHKSLKSVGRKTRSNDR